MTIISLGLVSLYKHFTRHDAHDKKDDQREDKTADGSHKIGASKFTFNKMDYRFHIGFFEYKVAALPRGNL